MKQQSIVENMNITSMYTCHLVHIVVGVDIVHFTCVIYRQDVNKFIIKRDLIKQGSFLFFSVSLSHSLFDTDVLLTAEDTAY